MIQPQQDLAKMSSYCYQNQPLDLSCHKNRPPSPAVSPPLFAVADVSSHPSPAMLAAAALGFHRRPDSSSDNDEDDDEEDDDVHHQSPDSAVDVSGEPPRRIRRCSSDVPFTDRRSPPGYEEEEEDRRRSFGYDIGPRKRFLSKFFTDPKGKFKEYILNTVYTEASIGREQVQHANFSL